MTDLLHIGGGIEASTPVHILFYKDGPNRRFCNRNVEAPGGSRRVGITRPATDFCRPCLKRYIAYRNKYLLGPLIPLGTTDMTEDGLFLVDGGWWWLDQPDIGSSRSAYLTWSRNYDEKLREVALGYGYRVRRDGKAGLFYADIADYDFDWRSLRDLVVELTPVSGEK